MDKRFSPSSRVSLSPSRCYAVFNQLTVNVYLTSMVGDSNGLVYPVSDSTTESIIQRTIEGIQRMIKLHNDQALSEGEERIATAKESTIEISLAAKRHWELEIKTLQDAPRDPDKLRELLKIKQRQYEKATHAEEIQQLVRD